MKVPINNKWSPFRVFTITPRNGVIHTDNEQWYVIHSYLEECEKHLATKRYLLSKVCAWWNRVMMDMLISRSRYLIKHRQYRAGFVFKPLSLCWMLALSRIEACRT